MEELIEVMGVRVNIWRGGSGEPLFLFPGWNGTFTIYKDLLEELSHRGFDVYGVEFPGVGRSDTPPEDWSFDDFIFLLEGILDYYGIEKAIIMGHSLGCVSALKFAGCFPDKVRNLTLVNSPILSKQEHWSVKNSFDVGFLVFVSLLWPAKWTVKVLGWPFRPFFNVKFAIDWLEGQYYFLTNEDGIMRKILRVVIETDTAEDARCVRAPALIVAGERGGITPVSNAEVLRENIPNNDFILIADGPHHFEGKWAEELAGIVAEWVNREKI